MKIHSAETNPDTTEETDENVHSHLYSTYQSKIKYYFELLALMLTIITIVIFIVFCATDYLFNHASHDNIQPINQISHSNGM